MRLRGVAVPVIAPLWPSGTPKGLPCAPNRRNLRKILPCAHMSKRNSPVSCEPIAALLFLDPACHGTVVGTVRERIDDGHGRGAQNKLQGA